MRWLLSEASDHKTTAIHTPVCTPRSMGTPRKPPESTTAQGKTLCTARTAHLQHSDRNSDSGNGRYSRQLYPPANRAPHRRKMNGRRKRRMKSESNVPPQIFTLLPRCGPRDPAADVGDAAGKTQVPDNHIYETHFPGYPGSPEINQSADMTDKCHS